MPEPEPPKQNPNRSHAIQEIIDTLLPDLAPATWMSDELLRSLEGAFEATRAHHLMAAVRAGRITPEEAQEMGGLTKVDLGMLIGVFDLGIQAGIKLEYDNQFREMLGEERI